MTPRTIIAAAICALMATPTTANPLNISGSTVTLSLSTRPGELAVVTFDNVSMNDQSDTGTYDLAIPGLAVQVQFTWEVDETGADQITVIPPAGITCIPKNCSTAPMEGFVGEVVLLDWVGF